MRTMMLAMELGDTSDRPETCALMTVPLFHLSGSLHWCRADAGGGAKTVWRLGKFEPTEVLRLIERERVTTGAGLGSIGAARADSPRSGKVRISPACATSVRWCADEPGAAGAHASGRAKRQMGVGLGYGSSESVTAVAMIGGEELSQYPTSVGRPQPTHEIQIRGGDGTVLPDGCEGEIFIRSPYIMRSTGAIPRRRRGRFAPGAGWLPATSVR
jgi:acyl-CoA synthetase (AMP-forming)/AMP-acid ligase II